MHRGQVTRGHVLIAPQRLMSLLCVIQPVPLPVTTSSPSRRLSPYNLIPVFFLPFVQGRVNVSFTTWTFSTTIVECICSACFWVLANPQAARQAFLQREKQIVDPTGVNGILCGRVTTSWDYALHAGTVQYPRLRNSG